MKEQTQAEGVKVITCADIDATLLEHSKRQAEVFRQEYKGLMALEGRELLKRAIIIVESMPKHLCRLERAEQNTVDKCLLRAIYEEHDEFKQCALIAAQALCNEAFARGGDTAAAIVSRGYEMLLKYPSFCQDKPFTGSWPRDVTAAQWRGIDEPFKGWLRVFADMIERLRQPRPPAEPLPVPENKTPRKRKEVTQKEAADLCRVDSRTIHNWDKGVSTPEGYPGRYDRVNLRAWASNREAGKQVQRAVKNTIRYDDKVNYSGR